MKKALVLAGGSDQIALIKELRSAYPGIEIILVDYYDNPPARIYSDTHIKASTLDKELVLKIAKEEKVDLVITACTDQALLTMTYVSEKLGLKCYLSYEQAMNVTNKSHMKDLMVKTGIPTAQHIIIESIDMSTENKLSYPLVIKPVDNNSSKGIFKVYSGEELRPAIIRAFSFSRNKKVLIEEFKEGKEYSVDAFLLNGEPKIILMSQNKKIRSNIHCFTIVQSIYPCDFSSVIQNKVCRIIKEIGEVFKLDNIPLLIQLIIDKNEINVIEFSARTGGGSKIHFIKKLTGVNVIRHLLEITDGYIPHLDIEQQDVYAAMNFIYTKPGIFCGISNIDSLKKNKVIFDYYYYKTVGMEIKSAEYSSDRSAAFFVIANTEKKLKEKIFYVDQNIQVLNENDEDIMLHHLYFS
jgi:phosphoribosylamine-glycine ligase